MQVHSFYRGLVQPYPLFSNLIKLSFRSWHLLIHESFTTGEVSFEHRAEELGYAFTLLANLEESGTGIRHEVGLAAFGINGYADFGYYYQVALGKGNGTSVDGLLFFFAEHAHLCCKPVECFLYFVLLIFIHGLRHCNSTFLFKFLHRVFKHRNLFLHDIVLHHIRHDEAIATHNDYEHKHGLIAQLVHNIVQPCNVMAHHWHCHQRQRSTNIHKPNLCLVAYGRYAYKQGKDERQCAAAECQ